MFYSLDYIGEGGVLNPKNAPPPEKNEKHEGAPVVSLNSWFTFTREKVGKIECFMFYL